MAQLPNIIEKERSLWTVVKWVFVESIRGSKRYSLIRYGASILEACFLFARFGALGIIVNEFTRNGITNADQTIILKGLILFIISEIGPSIVDALKGFAVNTQFDHLFLHIQKMYIEKMGYLDIGTIEQPELQDLYHKTNTQGWNAFFNIINQISIILNQLVAIIISCVSLFIVSPLALFIIIVGTLPTYFTEKKNSELTSKLQNSHNETWRLKGTKTGPFSDKHKLTEIKNFNITKIFIKKFSELSSKINSEYKSLRLLRMKNEYIGIVVLSLSLCACFFIIIHKVQIGALAIGSLVFSFSVMARFQAAINSLFTQLGMIIERKKNASSILDLIEMEPLVISGNKSIIPDDFQKLELKNVSFMYPGSDKNVIYNINLVIEKPMNLAIVGLNGAGKTTLLKLITRVYDPTEGEILVNGINLKEYDLDDWKRCMGILLQEYELYSEETIAENVMLGDVKKHDQNLVEQVCKQTTAHEFIKELSEGYQQKIGTEFRGGVELSKGQKQKLALARVLYRNAPIIILDEPTAAIDALSEDTIFKSLRENHTDQTRIIISHKFSNVRDADNIILIEHGQIIEQGSHEQLMNIDNGRYRELFELQAEGYK